MWHLAQPLVHDAVEATRLLGIAFDAVRHRFRRRPQEMVRLAEHGTDPTHLEHEPYQRLGATTWIAGEELPGLFREVNEDGAGFEERDRAARPLVINDRGYLAVGIEGDEVRSKLFALGDVDGVDAIG